MKRFRIYYYYVAAPVLLMLLGCVVFFPQIKSTIDGNPHPQINYMIFFLIAITIVQVWLHVRRINREAVVLNRFLHFIAKGDYNGAEQQLKADRQRVGRIDVGLPLHAVLQIRGGVVDSLTHRAVLEEVERFRHRLQRRLVLTQYMSGMMVGMGLLGTFIGLLGALAEIGELIGTFNMSAATTDIGSMISTLVSRLVAPMKSLGIAFSASMFGVFGSLLAGLLMVSVKAATNELSSILESRISNLMDFGLIAEKENHAASLVHALSELAQHSPVLRGLIIALDQSERRTREALSSVSLLAARMDANTQMSDRILQYMDQNLRGQQELQKMLALLQTDFPLMSQSQMRVEQLVETFTESAEVHHHTLQSLVGTQETAYREALQRFAEFTQYHQTAIKEQIDAARRQELQQQTLWQQQMRQYEDLYTRSLKAVQEQSISDHKTLFAEGQVVQNLLIEHKDNMHELLVRLENMSKLQVEVGQQLMADHAVDRNNLTNLTHQMGGFAESIRADGIARSEQLYKLHLQLIESLSRWEQILYVRQNVSTELKEISTSE